MKTFYKPTQWRGKHAVYVSIDPQERKANRVKGWLLLAAFLLVVAVAVWVVLRHR
jgi:ABC-type nickel/cobalt efflux system permease component RcnA